ncbi:hypothetical protein L210DRAFT_2537425 [Boletus edulis BED1]|uniref:Ankyrin repeat protein n=1 Tax=Boletus edulis BED1 TaxID=1328754 RepID=A0AAD4G626_BOLED|nr:hypothetical protein L210DRAFT_2537425 [Boletus edulis BED1]
MGESLLNTGLLTYPTPQVVDVLAYTSPIKTSPVLQRSRPTSRHHFPLYILVAFGPKLVPCADRKSSPFAGRTTPSQYYIHRDRERLHIQFAGDGGHSCSRRFCIVIPNEVGYTPLHVAVIRRYVAVVDHLLSVMDSPPLEDPFSVALAPTADRSKVMSCEIGDSWRASASSCEARPHRTRFACIVAIFLPSCTRQT